MTDREYTVLESSVPLHRNYKDLAVIIVRLDVAFISHIVTTSISQHLKANE